MDDNVTACRRENIIYIYLQYFQLLCQTRINGFSMLKRQMLKIIFSFIIICII